MLTKFKYEWPFNLIYDIFEDDELCKNPPKDIMHSIEYALFLLEDEYGSRCTEVIRLRYIDKLTYAEIARRVNRTPATIRQSLIQSIIRLSRPTRSGYIKYGIEGFHNHRVEEVAKNSYTQGYINGLKNSGDNKNDTDEMKILATQSICKLKIDIRAYNRLWSANIRTIEDLLNLDREDLIRIRGMSTRVHNEIIFALEYAGFNCDHLR